MCPKVIIWGILMHVKFLDNFCDFLQFFPGLQDTRGSMGVPQEPWGAPPKGNSKWVPFSNNLNIVRFWNILE